MMMQDERAKDLTRSIPVLLNRLILKSGKQTKKSLSVIDTFIYLL